MAIEHITAVLHGLFGVDPSEKLVMLIIAEHARRGERAVAYPSVDRIAALACLQVRQVQAIIGSLAREGWLTVERGGGRARTNLYHLNLERLSRASRNHAAGRTVQDGQKGAVGRSVSPVDNSGKRIPKGAAHCTDEEEERVQSTHEKGAVQRQKGCSGLRERVQPTAPEVKDFEPVLTGNPVPRAHALPDLSTGSGQATREPEPRDKNRNGEPRSKPSDQAAMLRLAASVVKPMRASPKTPEEIEAERQRQIAELQRLQAGGMH